MCHSRRCPNDQANLNDILYGLSLGQLTYTLGIIIPEIRARSGRFLRSKNLLAPKSPGLQQCKRAALRQDTAVHLSGRQAPDQACLHALRYHTCKASSWTSPRGCPPRDLDAAIRAIANSEWDPKLQYELLQLQQEHQRLRHPLRELHLSGPTDAPCVGRGNWRASRVLHITETPEPILDAAIGARALAALLNGSSLVTPLHHRPRVGHSSSQIPSHRSRSGLSPLRGLSPLYEPNFARRFNAEAVNYSYLPQDPLIALSNASALVASAPPWLFSSWSAKALRLLDQWPQAACAAASAVASEAANGAASDTASETTTTPAWARRGATAARKPVCPPLYAMHMSGVGLKGLRPLLLEALQPRRPGARCQCLSATDTSGGSQTLASVGGPVPRIWLPHGEWTQRMKRESSYFESVMGMLDDLASLSHRAVLLPRVPAGWGWGWD